MTLKTWMYASFLMVFILLMAVFFLQFTIRSSKDTLNSLRQKVEKIHDQTQFEKAKYGVLSSPENLKKLGQDVLGNRQNLAGYL